MGRDQHFVTHHSRGQWVDSCNVTLEGCARVAGVILSVLISFLVALASGVGVFGRSVRHPALELLFGGSLTFFLGAAALLLASKIRERVKRSVTPRKSRE